MLSDNTKKLRINSVGSSGRWLSWRATLRLSVVLLLPAADTLVSLFFLWTVEWWWWGFYLQSSSPDTFCSQVDPDQDASRSRLRNAQEKMVYSLVSVPEGNDISSIFELDPTTLRGGDSLVPRYDFKISYSKTNQGWSWWPGCVSWNAKHHGLFLKHFWRNRWSWFLHDIELCMTHQW